ncbi:hypothetical protein G6514_008302 [Epicoccum nigrum]|nr:hypothetical protein G6514_008302 [Epicoccum nigrum]
MAILDSCPGLEVKLVSNDKAFNEYRDSRAEDANNTITHYVEVESDGTFQINLQVTDAYKSKHGIGFDIRLDGQKVDHRLIRLEDLQKPGGHVFSGASHKMNGKWFVSDYKFSQFVLDFNSHTQLDGETTERLRDELHGISEFDRISEEVVKNIGLSHHGSVDMPRPNKGLHTMQFVAIDGYEDEKAQAVFVFKYRSLAILQAIGVAPTIPQTVGSRPLFSNASITIPLRQSRAPTEVPGSNQEIVTASAATTAAAAATGDLKGLTEEEIVALITHYRGHSQGLHGQNRARLLVLLQFYENKS